MPLLRERPQNPYAPPDGSKAATNYGADLSEENALPGQSYYDEKITNGLIGQQMGRDENAYKDLLGYGVSDAGSALPGGARSDPMARALQSKAERDTQSSLKGIQTRAESEAGIKESNTQSQVEGEMASIYENKAKNFEQQYAYEIRRHDLLNKWKQAQAQARSNLLSQIAGGIGAVGGAIVGGLAGGPVGAVAGASAGGKIGGSLGGG